MPIDIELIRENRAVLQTYHEPVSVQDMLWLKSQMDGVHLPAAQGQLHVIADFRQVHFLPDILMRIGIRMLNRAHPNTGVIILVTHDAVVTTMAAVFMRFYPSCALRSVASMDEAQAIVEALLTGSDTQAS